MTDRYTVLRNGEYFQIFDEQEKSWVEPGHAHDPNALAGACRNLNEEELGRVSARTAYAEMEAHGHSGLEYGRQRRYERPATPHQRGWNRGLEESMAETRAARDAAKPGFRPPYTEAVASGRDAVFVRVYEEERQGFVYRELPANATLVFVRQGEVVEVMFPKEDPGVAIHTEYPLLIGAAGPQDITVTLKGRS